MLKNAILLHCIVILCSCNQPEKKDTTMVTTPDTAAKQHTVPAPIKTDSLIIVPGESMGKLKLGDDASTLTAKLGKPDLSDAAMGKAWTTWLGKNKEEHNNSPELNVFTTYKDSSMKQVTVQLIRTSSAGFKTPNGIHVYNTLTDIKKAFPNLEQKGQFTQKNTHRTISIYDAEAGGIAFEITTAADPQLCIGIIVHPRNKNVMDHYLGFLFSRNWTETKTRQ